MNRRAQYQFGTYLPPGPMGQVDLGLGKALARDGLAHRANLTRTREDFAKGEYRWVASVMNDVVHADPSNRAARELGADALEQMGYQAEAGTWRNAYLVGAMELRDGVPTSLAAGGASGANGDMLKAVGNDLFFDFLGVRLGTAKAEGKHLVINWVFTDSNERVVPTLENSALTHVAGRQADADATVTVSRAVLDGITLRQSSFQAAMLAGDMKIEGNHSKLAELMGMLDSFQPTFPVVEPWRQVDNQ